MNTFSEHTWLAPVMGEVASTLMKTYVQYPPRKLQSDSYTGPITLTNSRARSDAEEPLVLWCSFGCPLFHFPHQAVGATIPRTTP